MMGIGITFLAMTIFVHFFQEKSVKEEHGTTLHEIIDSVFFFLFPNRIKIKVENVLDTSKFKIACHILFGLRI